MYTPGNILYFTPFYFPNGGKEKNKYFIVLATNQEKHLNAPLGKIRVKSLSLLITITYLSFFQIWNNFILF